MPRSVVLTILLLLPTPPGSAQDCGCTTTVAPCADYWQAAAVFVGRVEYVKRLPGAQLVGFALSESFRGAGSSSLEVLTGPPGHRCAVPFRVGREYVVYASRSGTSAPLTVAVCSRTRLAEDAAADVSYARALRDGGGIEASITGQLVLVPVDLNGRRVRAARPLAGIPVRVTRDGTEQSATTNQGGDFAVTNQGPGLYIVSADLPERYFTHEAAREIRVTDAKACAQVDLAAYDNGRVSGRVLDAGGRAVPGLTVELATTNLRQGRRALTDREGRFDLRRIPAGRFVLRSGIGKLAALSPVTIGPGAHVVLEDLRLPAGLSYVALSGFVLRPDGTPAEGARVYLKGSEAQDRILGEPATADFLGKFVIAGLAGADYRLFAELARGQYVEASEQLPVKAAAGLKPTRLVVRRQY